MPKVRAALHIAQPTIAAAISCQSNVASLISFNTERMKVINAPAIESSNHFQPVASCCSAKAAVEHAAINPPMPRCAYLSICIILFFWVSWERSGRADNLKSRCASGVSSRVSLPLCGSKCQGALFIGVVASTTLQPRFYSRAAFPRRFTTYKQDSS